MCLCVFVWFVCLVFVWSLCMWCVCCGGLGTFSLFLRYFLIYKQCTFKTVKINSMFETKIPIQIYLRGRGPI